MSSEVEVSIRIDAAPATVFRYFVDPERMCRWMGVSAEIDPTPGGVLHVDVNGRDTALGTYLEVVPQERVVFTWGWESNDGVPPGSTRVEITLAADGDGTVVRLRHSGLPDDDAATSHEHGWQHYLERLRIAAAGGEPGPDSFVTS